LQYDVIAEAVRVRWKSWVNHRALGNEGRAEKLGLAL